MPTRKSATKAAAPTPAAKPVAQAAVKTPSRPALKPALQGAATPPAAKPARAEKPSKPVKPEKAPKLRQKPVRDSFTMPEADFSLVATLKARALAGQRETKKSELLRGGIAVLAALNDAELKAVMARVERIKTGRPSK